MPGIVARVRPRTSKGITDLLLLSVSYGFRTVNPSKKSFTHEAQSHVAVKASARDTRVGKRRTWSVTGTLAPTRECESASRNHREAAPDRHADTPPRKHKHTSTALHEQDPTDYLVGESLVRYRN